MFDLICACTDLGVHIDGCEKGPSIIAKEINNSKINEKITISKQNVIKEKNKHNLQKNLISINDFSQKLFYQVDHSLKRKLFPIILGGDHTTAIGSILAALNNYDDLGVIWIDAHADFNTLKTTETGNIHGLPLAAVCGLCKKLTDHFAKKYINPKKCVIVGSRSIDQGELTNLKKYGVTFFSTNDIKEQGIAKILDLAFVIAGENVHISYDLDVIDPLFAPGVSIPVANGISEKDALTILKYLKNKKTLITSFDLVEYNPTFDDNEKTLNIALNLLRNFIND